MTLGLPWSVEDLRPDARETALEAARRAGMSVGDWLNTVILEQAAEAGVRAPHASVAPPVQPVRREPPRVPAALESALAEIAARQRILKGEPAPAAPIPEPMSSPAAGFAPLLPPQSLAHPIVVPAQNLTGLEDQLRRITDQIETLRRPGVEQAIDALREELAEIGRALNEAMPRDALDAIERQIYGLSERLAEGRQMGADGHALAALEQGLAEVRDALRELTPAENLVGIQESVAVLAHKIDLVVAEKDPEMLHQLQHAITTLREMAAHVASNEAVGMLAEQVQELAQKVDQLGAVQGVGDAWSSLERRIDALSKALAERTHNGASVPPRLEALVQSLADKIERIQETRGEPVSAHLEERIVQLVERLDASDSRLSHLEAIERGLGDLLLQVEDLRASRQSDTLRAEAQSAVGVDALKHDLARTHTTLEAVNGTLGSLVDRLARMEEGLRGSQRTSDTAALPELKSPALAVTAPELAPPSPPAMTQASAPHVQTPALQRQAPAPQALATGPGAHRAARIAPINPDLPPDQPLEPGSGPPRPRTGARIAADGADRPAKSSFIAAARRAAQAAVQDAGARLPKNGEAAQASSGEAPVERGLKGKAKAVLVAASVAAIVIGAYQIGGPFIFGGGDRQSDKNPVQPLSHSELQTEPPAAAPDRLTADALSPTPMLAQPKQPAAAPAPSTNTPSPPPAAEPDVTGSIPDAASSRAASPADRLPIEIGGTRLRSAAANGDGAAAYEIANRYAEGRGVIADVAEAARWYERAAAKGVALAQFRYASMLEKGVGVKKDLAQARRYYTAAAEQGNAKAMHNLAVLYAEGIEGKPDYANAVQWFTKASEHGIADSQYNLAVLAARGLGMTKTLSNSYKWFSLAATQGDKEAARKRDEIAGKLDAKTLAAAQHDVKSFTPLAPPSNATVVATPPGGWDDAQPQGQGKAGVSTTAPIKVGKR
jgi:localization factor PodJL